MNIYLNNINANLYNFINSFKNLCVLEANLFVIVRYKINNSKNNNKNNYKNIENYINNNNNKNKNNNNKTNN